ncbi:DEHYDRATION-RESPONSIVE ELEMENT-BINDING PROTEIN 1D [Salix viminalis]|uniref:DEHYDRATION-RESPONSIVE ELEMENT-BINDING PROTEIN 1D n=1 Tax=Salix viminalis TaxID=40686 RepID=A0A9Q0NUK2_SALVM|nr:DEHYDRATION-RESPONSIVE ELEMENT-BINDING PROTEIN 1D [Salix viminalis]
MDIFFSYSDQNPIGSINFLPVIDEQECSYSSALSDSSITSSVTKGVQQAAIFSDEEVMLASRNPKKRAGRKKFRETRHPVYRGVRRRNSGKWVCEVREPNKKSRIWLGTFPTADMAARAHDVAALALRGRSACLNFADSAWRLPVPASRDAKDIQKAAAEAAEAFRPEGCLGVDLTRTGEEVERVAETAAGELFYMDDEADFGMPGLLANIAEGMLLPPPNCWGCSGGDSWDTMENNDTDITDSIIKYCRTSGFLGWDGLDFVVDICRECENWGLEGQNNRNYIKLSAPCQTQIALRSSAGFESLNQPTGWRRSQPINFSSLVLEVIFPLIKPSTNQISSGKLLISHTGSCSFPPYPPKTEVVDLKIALIAFCLLSSPSAALNNLQQRSRVHFV